MFTRNNYDFRRIKNNQAKHDKLSHNQKRGTKLREKLFPKKRHLGKDSKTRG